MQLMRGIRESIKEGRFPQFVQAFFKRMFPNEDFPQWLQEALSSVNVDLKPQLPMKQEQELSCNEETKNNCPPEVLST